MVRRRGPRLTLAEKTELWRRWRRGESLNAIGRALGRIAHVVRYEVARTGGIPPPARQRSRLALTLTEREAISRGLASGTSVRQISRQLRRAPSTVSREVRRHGGRRRYRAATASQDTGLSHTGGYTRGDCCIDRLNRQAPCGVGASRACCSPMYAATPSTSGRRLTEPVPLSTQCSRGTGPVCARSAPTD